MLFSSLTFIFIYLPIVLILYFFTPRKYKNILLLVVSLLFYSWGEPKYIIIMIFSIVINYIFGIIMDKNKEKTTNKKIVLIISIIFNIGLLVLFKYANFIIGNINNIFNISIDKLNIIMPIGISFYTFQILSYVVDVYRKKVEVQKNILTLGAYIALFPQLIAGPIVRYETVEKELSERKHTLQNFIDGSKRFIIGIGKKVIIANNVAVIADQILDSSAINSYSSIIVWIGMISYTLQIYYDFSGYSDMAIGLGKIFGFTFLENFNYPYVSKSITDFWRRWHISLSSWFKDYVYIPLGGNRTSKPKRLLNIMIVWLLTGLWHGASWNFVLWGIYYGIILIIEKLFLKNILEKLPNIIQMIYSFFIIVIGWTIFRIESLDNLLMIIGRMFSFDNSGIIPFIKNNYELLNYVIFIVLGIVGMYPLIGKTIKNLDEKNKITQLFVNVFLIIVFIISILFLVKSSYNPFIYFRF